MNRLRRTLGEHYRVKRETYRVDFAQNYDDDLSRIFGKEGERRANDFLKRRRTALRQQISRWTGIRCYTVDEVLKDWIARARKRKLYVTGDEEQAFQDVLTALTVRAMQYLQSGHYRVAL